MVEKFVPKELNITENAVLKVKNLIAEENKQNLHLRVFVTGGGCSGFQYDFSFDKVKNDDDLVFNNILIDKTSADMLQGSEVDFSKELIGQQFKINNPQSKSSCGCGVSFSL